MTAYPSLEPLAFELFQTECDQALNGRSPVDGVTPADLERCPLRWLLPGLVQLLADARHEPAHQLEGTVRRLIAEQGFTDDSGDAVVEAGHGAVIDFYVAVFIRTLEQLRQTALRSGAWSNAPVAPEMFG